MRFASSSDFASYTPDFPKYEYFSWRKASQVERYVVQFCDHWFICSRLSRRIIAPPNRAVAFPLILAAIGTNTAHTISANFMRLYHRWADIDFLSYQTI